uniref:probable splicing factor 3A subunit 1 n=1 Tax=Erigeron canadensis TaxID=72917 RepID=UPI001CB8BBD6|nr:probable splicing factor 3A subunit 1 [Erigeron canadensis]
MVGATLVTSGTWSTAIETRSCVVTILLCAAFIFYKMLGSLPTLPLPAPPSDGDLGPPPAAQVQNDSDDELVQVVEEDQNRSNASHASIATHTRTIGIIQPPPDLRTIVDKTASFVAKNGLEFERRVIASNSGKPMFNFFNGSDPYHAYYQDQLSKFRSQNQVLGQ